MIAFVVLGFGSIGHGIAWADLPRGPSLIRMLSGGNEAIRAKALLSLENDDARKVASLEEMIDAARLIAGTTTTGQLATPSTLRLLSLIGTVDRPESEGLLVELLDARHVGIAMISADVLGKNKFFGAIEFLKRQVDRPEYESMYAFRFNLVRSLVQMEHPDAIEFLDHLKGTLDGQLRWEIEQVLAGVDEELLPVDDVPLDQPEPVKQRESMFQPASYVPESLRRIKLERPQQYYGIDIRAKRMMFIIDRSGSMRHYSGGMTRLERAKAELILAIEALPPDAEFSILFFNTAVRTWRDELMVASDQNKREATEFVRTLGCEKSTNTYGALRRSLEFDDDLEAVFLLTDGRPTAGDLIAPAAIVSDIVHRNRFRHLKFNTIGIAVAGPTQQFLKTLADQSAGEFRPAN